MVTRAGLGGALLMLSCGLSLAALGACVARAGEDRQCEFNDQCAEGLVCSGARCRNVCRTERDCPEGRLCRATGQAGRTACVRAEDVARCVDDGECGAEKRCAIDGTCRAVCANDEACAATSPEARCETSGVCSVPVPAGSAPPPDAGAVDAGDAGGDAGGDAAGDAADAGPNPCPQRAPCAVTPRATPPSCATPGTAGCAFVGLPGGTFDLGGTPMGLGSDAVQRGITVSGLVIDAYEVTVARFARFREAGLPSPPAGSVIQYPGGHAIAFTGRVREPSPRAEDTLAGACQWPVVDALSPSHPVTCVDYWTAMAFCVWDGGRLPTEAEWEWAAHGPWAGLATTREYPWGSRSPMGCVDGRWQGCETGPVGPVSVDTTISPPTAPTLMAHLAGNVAEWTADNYAPMFAAPTPMQPDCWVGAPLTDPLCVVSDPAFTTLTVNSTYRGGGWASPVSRLLVRLRPTENRNFRSRDVGFRCVRPVP